MRKAIKSLNYGEYGYCPPSCIIVDKERDIYLDGLEVTESMRSQIATIFVQREDEGFKITLDRNYLYPAEVPSRRSSHPVRVTSIFGINNSKLPIEMFGSTTSTIKTISNLEGKGYVKKGAIKVISTREAYVDLDSEYQNTNDINFDLIIIKTKDHIQITIPEWVQFPISPDEIADEKNYLLVDKITGTGSYMPIDNIIDSDHCKLRDEIMTVKSMRDGDIGYMDPNCAHMDNRFFLLLENDAEVVQNEDYTHTMKVSKKDRFYHVVLDSDHVYAVEDLATIFEPMIYVDSINGVVDGIVPSNNIEEIYDNLNIEDITDPSTDDDGENYGEYPLFNIENWDTDSDDEDYRIKVDFDDDYRVKPRTTSTVVSTGHDDQPKQEKVNKHEETKEPEKEPEKELEPKFEILKNVIKVARKKNILVC